MGLIRRHPTACALALLLVLAALALHDALQLWRATRLNDQILRGDVAAVGPTAAPELRFAAAWQQAASGAGDAALQRYGALQGDSPIGQAARFNSANLLLRQAAAMRAGAHPGQALALVELAKEHYREILRADPAQWDARYNLDRAQRMVPDPEEVDETPLEGRRNAERAATTMRGHSPGLP